VLTRARGIYIEDIDGKKFIDMHGNGVHNAGFNNPAVIEAVKKQLDEDMTFCPRRFTNVAAVKLVEITPAGLCRSLFCPGGSEAIEMALMLGKSFGGGLMPFAGIVTHEKYNVCRQRSLGHYTHEKNALCAAAAMAEIGYIEKNNLPSHAAELGLYALRSSAIK
jgi:4-aminobutyrate aminotransferase-like enzyme